MRGAGLLLYGVGEREVSLQPVIDPGTGAWIKQRDGGFMSTNDKARIRELNDALRVHGQGGQTVATFGVNQLPGDVRQEALRKIRETVTFTDDNDPHQEHDFGAVEAGGYKLFWKIEYFDKNDSSCGSEDPADPEQTHRVMTIMLAEEY